MFDCTESLFRRQKTRLNRRVFLAKKEHLNQTFYNIILKWEYIVSIHFLSRKQTLELYYCTYGVH